MKFFVPKNIFRGKVWKYFTYRLTKATASLCVIISFSKKVHPARLAITRKLSRPLIAGFPRDLKNSKFSIGQFSHPGCDFSQIQKIASSEANLGLYSTCEGRVSRYGSLHLPNTKKFKSSKCFLPKEGCLFIFCKENCFCCCCSKRLFIFVCFFGCN